MSTIKSSAEDLTLNADGSGNDVIIQSNASTKAIVTAEGNVGIGLTPSGAKLHISNTNAGSQERGLYVDVSPEAGTSPNNLAMFMAGNGNITTPLVRIHHESPAADQLLLQCDTTGSNTVKFSVDEDGDVNLTGNLVIGTSGKGIDFSATADSSETMTSEILDDYEEGEWTPTVSSGSISVNRNVYTKIGRMVVCKTYVTVDSTGSGTFEMQGLPYSVGQNTAGGEVMLKYANISGGSTYHLATYVNTGNYIIFYRAEDNGNWVDLNWSTLSTSSSFYFTVTYFV